MDRIRFLKLFEKEQQEVAGNPESSSVENGSFQLSMNEECKFMLLKIKNKFGIIMSVGESWRFFVLCRKMLLEREKFQTYNHQNNEGERNPMAIYLYNKIQIGLTKQSKPIQWIFCEFMVRQSETQSNQFKQLLCSFFASTCFIFQVFTQDNFQSLSQLLICVSKIVKTLKFKDILPDIILIVEEEKQKLISAKVGELKDKVDEILNKISFIKYIEPFDDSKEDQQFGNVSKLRQISLNGRKILNQISVKKIDKVAVNPNCMINFVLNFMVQANQEINLAKIWKYSYTLQIQSATQKILLQYESKFEELTLGKEIISKEIFEDAHLKSKNQCMKLLRQRLMKQFDSKVSSAKQIQVGQSQALQPELSQAQMKIQESKKAIQAKNVMNISKWVRQLLKNEFVSIQKKIKQQEIKSINSYKQQMIMLKEFFKKKTESFLTIELFEYYEDFIFQKFFDHAGTIATYQTHNSTELIKTLKLKNAELENQSKEFRKKLTRDEQEYKKKETSLNEKIHQLQTKIQLQQKTIERLTQESLEKNKNHEKKVTKLNEQKYSQSQQFKRKLDELQNTLQQKINEILILESQIKKQKLLHEQSHENYKQLIALFKDNEAKMMTEIKFIELNSQQEIEELKQTTIKQAQGYQEIKHQVQIQSYQWIKRIQEKESEIIKLKEQIKCVVSNCEETVQKQIRLRDDLEIKNKMLEEKNIEFEIKLTKFKRIEEQMKKAQKDKEESMGHKNEVEKKALIAQQRVEFVEESLRLQKEKNRTLSEQIHETKAVAQELHALNNKYGKSSQLKIMVDQWVQADQESYKEKLREALQIISHLELEYNKLRADLRNSKITY